MENIEKVGELLRLFSSLSFLFFIFIFIYFILFFATHAATYCVGRPACCVFV